MKKMQRFFWAKMVLILVGIVAVLQVVHLILLNRLEARHHRKDETEDHVFSAGNEAEAAFASLVRTLHDSRILDSSGEYQLVPNLATATRQPAYKPLSSVSEIALVTQCSLKHLHNLVPLVQFWRGPVSIAIFAEDHEISDALWSIAGLRICHPAIVQNVSFHLISPLSADGRSPLSVPNNPSPPCKLQNFKKAELINYTGNKKFPNNLLRNTARKGTAAEFVLVIDIDMIPSSNLREDFYNFAIKNHLFSESRQEDKTVYVLPSFESKVFALEQQNKQKLLRLISEGSVRPFYFELCHKCQVHTDYDAWQKEPPTKGISPLFEVLWKDPWEPFYISRNSVPFYDERFKQYGFNRISQVCELHVAGYKFSVLNNGFLVHNGFKTLQSFHAARVSENDRNRILFRQFKVELRYKYPESSRRCY